MIKDLILVIKAHYYAFVMNRYQTKINKVAMEDPESVMAFYVTNLGKLLDSVCFGEGDIFEECLIKRFESEDDDEVYYDFAVKTKLDTEEEYES